MKEINILANIVNIEIEKRRKVGEINERNLNILVLGNNPFSNK
jgi:hypothetical protein